MPGTPLVLCVVATTNLEKTLFVVHNVVLSFAGGIDAAARDRGKFVVLFIYSYSVILLYIIYIGVTAQVVIAIFGKFTKVFGVFS